MIQECQEIIDRRCTLNRSFFRRHGLCWSRFRILLMDYAIWVNIFHQQRRPYSLWAIFQSMSDPNPIMILIEREIFITPHQKPCHLSPPDNPLTISKIPPFLPLWQRQGKQVLRLSMGELGGFADYSRSIRACELWCAHASSLLGLFTLRNRAVRS